MPGMPPQPGTMPPAPPVMEAPLPTEDEPVSKKQRTEDHLVPEAQFVTLHKVKLIFGFKLVRFIFMFYYFPAGTSYASSSNSSIIG